MSQEAPALCLYARKGGNGRTLLAQQLAGAFAEQIKVLVIDQDPQGSISKNFFGVTEVERLRAHQTVAAVYQGDDYAPDEIVRPTAIENISVAPANDYLEPFDLPRDVAKEHLFRLRAFISRVNRDHDVILIDTPPNVSNLLGWASLAASEYVVTPLLPAKNSVEAVFDIKKRLQVSMTEDNPALIDLGYFVTNFDARQKIDHAQLATLNQLHGAQIFETVIYRRKGFIEAPYSLLPVTHREPKSKEAEMIRALMREIVQKIQQRIHRLDAIENEEHDQARQANSTS